MGRKIPLYIWIYVGFLVVLAVNGVMVWLAVTTFNGVSTEDAYNQGLRYNAVLAERARVAEKGWNMVMASGVAAGGQRVAVTMRDGRGEAVSGARGDAVLRRPTVQGYDHAFVLTEVSHTGVYEAVVPVPLPGQWQIDVVMEKDGLKMGIGRRVDVRTH